MQLNLSDMKRQHIMSTSHLLYELCIINDSGGMHQTGHRFAYSYCYRQIIQSFSFYRLVQN